LLFPLPNSNGGRCMMLNMYELLAKKIPFYEKQSYLMSVPSLREYPEDIHILVLRDVERYA
jgi:hypothetical protein